MFSHFDPVVITSADPRPSEAFTGYAFVDQDLVVGPAGAKAWREKGDRQLTVHQDGCYFLARTMDGTLEVSADFKGYAKVFVYERDGHWAVSNSFARLVEAVKKNGWSVTPNEHVLATWSQIPAFWQQLTTFQTAAREIRLLPRQNVLRIRPDGSMDETVGAQPQIEPDPKAYQRELARFLNVWLGRTGTCIRGTGTQLSSELSGGLGSRVTLSLLLGLRQYFNVDFPKSLMLESSPRQPVDLELAKGIAATYRLKINEPMPSPGMGTVYIDPYQRWWDFSMGSYAPHYWVRRSHAQGRFNVGGHGGEGHRSYWPYESPHAMLEETREAFPSEAIYAEAVEAFDETRDLLSRAYEQVPPTIAHYREFRDRLHSGLHVQHTIRLQPLSSSLMYDVARYSDLESLESGQMLYDIMLQLAPGLAVMPYDKPGKAPDDEALRRWPGPVALRPMRGEVIGLNSRYKGAPRDLPDPWLRLQDSFADALRNLPDGLVRPEIQEQARAALDTVKEKGRLGHSRDGGVIQHIMLAALVSS